MKRQAQRAANLQRLRSGAPRVEVVIEELVLHGFSALERHAIGDALSGELERMFMQGDYKRSFHQNREAAILDAGRISISARAQPTAVGAQVARAVYAVLSTESKGGKK